MIGVHRSFRDLPWDRAMAMVAVNVVGSRAGVKTTMVYTHVLNRGGKGCAVPQMPSKGIKVWNVGTQLCVLKRIGGKHIYIVRPFMIEYKYSTFWPRFCAGFIDGLIFMPVGWIYSFTFSHFASVPLRILACVISSSAFLVYSIWMHGRRGQTLGKMACKVVVLDVSERPLSMRQAVLRDIFGVVLLPIGLAINISGILRGIDISLPANFTAIDWIITYSAIGWFLIEVVTMLTNDKRRALHDFIAGSVVIRRPNSALQPTPPRRSVDCL